ncbi:MAG: ABC transporter permease [Candidatus Moranbacteria bacterium]|nr:ABC transporter permease [Candidatus Moranbacteria bacterium]
MKTIKLFRTFNEGVQNFRRDKWLTAVTVMVMSLALYLIGVSFLSGFGILTVVNNIENRINISMNFDSDIAENEILEIKKEVEKIQEVQSVIYISREDIFNNFNEQYKDSREIMKTLEVIEENPFLTSLLVTADNVEHYENINTYLTKTYKNKMYSNYDKNKGTIGELHNFIVFIRNVSLGLGAIMIIISILLNLNTIRMSLYANRKEFEIMRLVGASNLYVKLPTVFEGFLYGLTSSFLTIVALIITVYATDPFIKKMLPDVKIAEFYTKHIIEICLIVIALGVVLGTISSYIAIRRYLEK